jgi:predicted DNA-binding transcriptional regulator YafY
MGSREILGRRHRLLLALAAHPRGLSSERLAQLLRSSRPTVDRDLAALRRDVATIDRRRMGGEVWHVLRGMSLSLSLLPAQVAALRLAREALSSLRGTSLADELDTILAGAPSPSTDAPVRRVRVTRAGATRRPDVMTAVGLALDRGQRVRITTLVASRGGARGHYTLDPLALRVVDGTAYLDGFALERGELRTFKVERIERVEPTGERADPHPDIDLDALFASAVKTWTGDATRVRVRIASEAAWAVPEYRLSPEQQLVREPDGSVIVEATVAGLVEVTRWVLSWGRHAEALEPPALRAAVRAELDGALDRYEGQEDRSTKLSGPTTSRPADPAPNTLRSTARTTQVRGRARAR